MEVEQNRPLVAVPAGTPAWKKLLAVSGGVVVALVMLFSALMALVVLLEGESLAWKAAMLFPLALYFLAFRNVRRSLSSRRWPAARGEITAAKIEEKTETDEDGDTSTRYEARVRYEYAVNGQRYEGDRITFGYEAGGSRSDHEKVLARYVPGQAVEVLYNPRKPQLAVLETKTEWWNFSWHFATAAVILLVISGNAL
jgi:hypothetical protein